MAKYASRNSRSSLRVAEPTVAGVGTLFIPGSEAASKGAMIPLAFLP